MTRMSDTALGGGWQDDAAHDPIHAAAADWLVRIEDANVSAEDVIAWRQWMQADPRHEAAFKRIEEAWNLLGGANPCRMGGQRTVKRPWLAVAAAAGLVLAVAGWLTVHMGTSTTVMQTAVGENRRLRLPDGSEVTLGGDTTLELSFDERARDIEISQGEALFSVVKDAARPFRVHVGDTTVTALGTQFNVRRGAEQTVVAVLEGRVAVEPSGHEPIRLAAGEQTILKKKGTAVATHLRDPSATTAWRKGLLSFQSEPLRSVLEDVNRYSAKPVVLADPAIGSIRITGTVMQDNLQEWVGSLENAFELRASEEEARIVLSWAR